MKSSKGRGGRLARIMILIGLFTPFYTIQSSAQQISFKTLVADICTAYVACMGITTFHELGHALAYKYFYNRLLDITLGTTDRRKPAYITFGPFKLRGLNPLAGVASPPEITISRSRDEIRKFLKRQAVVALAGPFIGALVSLGGICLTRKYAPSHFSFTKWAFIGNIFAQTIFPEGVAGIFEPSSDTYCAYTAIRALRNNDINIYINAGRQRSTSAQAH